MARQIRIEYSGAFYHVTSRGNRKHPIFLSEEDRLFFLRCLGDAHDRFKSVFHVYCLMGNHYHLFLETPFGELSKIMHLINTTYSVYFNKKHGCCGHPFQGRFTSILVQAEEYARELAPYIHLNPARAKLVSRPEHYQWSNYCEYLGLVSAKPWTTSSFVLGLFGASTDDARHKYEEYVLWRLSQNLPSPLDPAKKTGILGNSEFIERIKKTYLFRDDSGYDRELPQSNKLISQYRLPDILGASELVIGPKNRYSRKAAIYISHKRTNLSLSEIGGFFQIGVSGVTDICRRMRKELNSNGTLAQAIEEIERRLRG
jgi:putative transposase